MTRTCRNGHVTPVLYSKQGRLRCLECERERCRRYYSKPEAKLARKQREAERRQLVALGWA